MITTTPSACHDCGARPGQLHTPGCDVEHCPRCGLQAIGCDCIYLVCGMDPDRLEEDHPDIFCGGPTPEMHARWDALWSHRRMPWTGEWPGAADAARLGLWCRWVEGRSWVECGADHPEATPDLNRLPLLARWDQDSQRWEMPT